MTAQERTQIIIDRERNSGEDEYTRLHAISCMTFDWDVNDSIAHRDFVDDIMIAARLDEIRKEFSPKTV